MSLLYPKFPANRLPAMVWITLLGAVVAGCYGAVHDQVSYTIAPEYFTKLKFRQFFYTNFGWPPRLFAAEVGFLATWWVGLLAGWLVARAGLAELPAAQRWPCTARAFAIILGSAIVAGLAGVALGITMTGEGNLGVWRPMAEAHGIEDLRAFVVVAFLHDAGYLGGLAGLLAAIVHVRRRVRRSRSVAAPSVTQVELATTLPRSPGGIGR